MDLYIRSMQTHRSQWGVRQQNVTIIEIWNIAFLSPHGPLATLWVDRTTGRAWLCIKLQENTAFLL